MDSLKGTCPADDALIRERARIGGWYFPPFFAGPKNGAGGSGG